MPLPVRVRLSKPAEKSEFCIPDLKMISRYNTAILSIQVDIFCIGSGVQHIPEPFESPGGRTPHHRSLEPRPQNFLHVIVPDHLFGGIDMIGIGMTQYQHLDSRPGRNIFLYLQNSSVTVERC